MTFYCNEMEGRYVNIVIPGQKRFLTLCEVEITGEPVEKPRAAGNIKPIFKLIHRLNKKCLSK